jgi:uncharacterized membrane protein
VEGPARRPGILRRLVDPMSYLGAHVGDVVPRLQRLADEGESTLGVATAILLAIALQYSLPNRVSHYQRWVFPSVALVLVSLIVLGHRGRINERSTLLRSLTLFLVALMAVANGISAGRLVRDLVAGEGIHQPATLLFAGAAIWLTNVIVFALVYWLFDGGGPVARFELKERAPRSFLFPQHQMDPGEPERMHWAPVFFDYFYTSFTNATAFSPTDVMPLTRWAKFAMMLESALSLVLAILVVARAVNIL